MPLGRFVRAIAPLTRPIRPLVVLLALALPIVGCGDSNGPSAQVIAGSWSGNFTAGSTAATLTMTVTESNGNIAGSGSLSSGSNAIAVTVSGTFTSPNASLTLNSPGFNPTSLAGTVNGTQMTGTLNGSGFVNTPITLTRQGQ